MRPFWRLLRRGSKNSEKRSRKYYEKLLAKQQAWFDQQQTAMREYYEQKDEQRVAWFRNELQSREKQQRTSFSILTADHKREVNALENKTKKLDARYAKRLVKLDDEIDNWEVQTAEVRTFLHSAHHELEMEASDYNQLLKDLAFKVARQNKFAGLLGDFRTRVAAHRLRILKPNDSTGTNS